MRRFLLIIIVIALPFSALAAEGGKSIPSWKISSLISEYSACDGVEVVNLGRIALGALKGIVRISSGCEVLVEASGDGDRVTIYGYLDEKSNLIRDCIIYTPSSCALICLFGNFSMDTIAKIAEND